MVLQTLGYWEDDEWISSVNEEVAQSIVDYRGTEVFETVFDLKKVAEVSEIYEQIKDQLTVQTGFFSVKVTGIVNMVEKKNEAVIRREGAGGERVVKVVYWTVE